MNGKTTRAMSSPPAMATQKWHHLKLFPKLALLFLLLVAAPLLALTLLVSQQSRLFSLERQTLLREDLIALSEKATQKHQRTQEALFDRNHQELGQVGKQALSRLKNSLLTVAQNASAKQLEQFRAESLASDARDHALQAMVSADVTNLAEQFRLAYEQELQQMEAALSAKIEAHRTEVRQNGSNQREALRSDLDGQVAADFERAAAEIHENLRWNIIPLILGVGFLIGGIGIFGARRMISPLKNVAAVAAELAQGNVQQTAPVVASHDEIEALAQAVAATTAYLQKIVQGAQNIAAGDFTEAVTPVSEKDALGAAFHNMTAYLRELAGFAANLSQGDLSRVVTPKSTVDTLGLAIHHMTVYLQRITQVAKQVAEGNLSENAPPLSARDFLGNAFAEMIGKLRYMVSKIRLDAGQLVLMSQETQHRAQEEAASVAKISRSVEETSSAMTQMGISIADVNENMQGLASFVGETSSSIEEMTSSIRQIVLHSEQLAAASEDTSASIQQISASLQQIAETTQHSKMLSDGARRDAMDGREAVEKMIQSMRVIQHTVTVTAEAIQLLNKRTESIEKILEVIKDISEQTSLLSINASIIAKKAGERGRGFNVIADKVRKLAEQSSSSAKEIALIIRAVRKEAVHAVTVVATGDEKVREGVTLAELAGKALDKIIAGANESSAVVARIAETTEEQTKISHYIMESMDQVVEMVNQIKRATKEQEQSSSFIMHQAEQILLASEQVKQSTLEQTKVVKHVTLAMDDIRGLIHLTAERTNAATQAATMLSQHAHALKQLVSQFTI